MKAKLVACLLLLLAIICSLYFYFTNDFKQANNDTNIIQKEPNEKKDDTNELIADKKYPILTFSSQLEIEYGSDILSDALIQDIKGELVEQSYLDTSKIGKQNLLYRVKLDDEVKDFYHEIRIVDTKAPVITSDYNALIFDHKEKIDFSLLNIQVYDEVDGSFTQAQQLEPNTYILDHQIDTAKAGEYILTIKALDAHGLTSEKTIQIIVKEEDKPISNDHDNQQHDSSKVEPTYINGILLVNKTHPVPRDFGGNDQSANDALLALQNGAYLAGYDMPLLSGYRSYDYQKSLYDAYVARDGQEAADRYSARPGTSEHQTGLAFDVGVMSWDYGDTPAGRWLVENCAKYGFILRYLEGKESITGYMYEPWHIRYVGVEHATNIMNQGITLEEYLGVQ